MDVHCRYLPGVDRLFQYEIHIGGQGIYSFRCREIMGSNFFFDRVYMFDVLP